MGEPEGVGGEDVWHVQRRVALATRGGDGGVREGMHDGDGMGGGRRASAASRGFLPSSDPPLETFAECHE